MQRQLHRDLALSIHKIHQGKVSICPKIKNISYEDFSYIYTPYVAEVCRAISKDPSLKYDLTSIGNTIAIVTNGSRILGLGNIGPEAGHPVMEGKSLLFKILGGVDAYPLSINTTSYQDIVTFIQMIKPSISGVNLEDISQPDVFLAWQELQDIGIPVFHDDMEGTAIVIMAGIINAIRIVKKQLEKIRVVFIGGGSAGLGFAILWKDMGLPKENLTFIDRRGIISIHREDIKTNPVKTVIAQLSSQKQQRINEAIDGADILIGASSPGAIKPEYIEKMSDKPIIFALSNPIPEIFPEEAYKAGAFIVATGRSDFPNQLNNSLVFPGIFRGALSARATKITPRMKTETVYALVESINKPSTEKIVPRMNEKHVYYNIALKVAQAAIEDNVANIEYNKIVDDITTKLR